MQDKVVFFSFRYRAAFTATPFGGLVLFSMVLQISNAVSSRLQCPLRSSSKLDNFRLERIHVIIGLTRTDARAQDLASAP